MQMKCQSSNPWGSSIMQYLYGLNDNFIPSENGATVDIISNLLIGTKNTRYGTKPSIEGQYRIRQVIKQNVEAGKPIPVLVPWGSIKADFSKRLDIAEVHALSTLSELNKRVKLYYTPGLDINIRIEDWSGVDLFKLESGFNVDDSWSYCDDLENLINMMGNLNAKRESKMKRKDEFYACAAANTNAILPYLIESAELIKTNPEKCVDLISYKNLKANGWRGIISDAQREHYLHCYRKLYDGEDFMLRRLSLYFGGSLARFQLGMTGANHEWGKNYIQIVFVPPVKGAPEGYNDNYLYYRTIPMNQCRTHAAPWRAKGYFQIGDDEVPIAKLTTFKNQPEGLQHDTIIFEEGDKRVVVNSDFVV